MALRSTLAATVVAVALLGGAAQATGSSTLDGTKRTDWSYQGQLDDSTLSTPGQGRDVTDAALEPHQSDCTPTSCDVSMVRLTVPRGRQSGRFTYDVVLSEPVVGSPNTLATTVAALYNSKGERVLRSSACCMLGTLRLTHPRLLAGNYKIVIYNQGAPTRFVASLKWVANPPHRSR